LNVFLIKTIFADPTVYITSKLAKTMLIGSENWFVMVNAPANNGQNWDELKQNKAKPYFKINKQLNIKLEDLIENEEILDPRSIEANTSSFRVLCTAHQ
jgi:hypothetical protein